MSRCNEVPCWAEKLLVTEIAGNSECREYVESGAERKVEKFFFFLVYMYQRRSAIHRQQRDVGALHPDHQHRVP